MSDIQNLVDKLSGSKKHEVFWLGAADKDQIKNLENSLSVTLPGDLKAFLEITGGGGVVEQEISGIEDNNASLEFGGTIFYDTKYCREEFSLPDKLIVIYFKDDEICWCIDTSNENYGVVVSYDIFSKKIAKNLHDSFYEFFKEYVELRI